MTRRPALHWGSGSAGTLTAILQGLLDSNKPLDKRTDDTGDADFYFMTKAI